MFDLKWFAHGLNIFNLTKGNAPEETFANDTVTPQIVQAHAQQRASAREIEEYDHDTESWQRDKRLIDRVIESGAHIYVDRLALMRSLHYIEKRWRDGASCDEVFSEVDAFRVLEYDKIVRDKAHMRKVENWIRSTAADKMRNTLVLGKKIRTEDH